MIPLSKADLRGVDGVAFDVDDTLTTHGVLSAEAYGSLTALHRAGVRLMAVTGRPLGWADAMAATWPIDAAVGENGAGWSWRQGPALRTAYADDPVTRQEQRDVLSAIRRSVRSRMPHVKEAGDQPGRRCDLAFDVAESERLPDPDIESLVALIEEHGATATVSSVHAHAVPGDWDKARGLTGASSDALGSPLDASRWVFVGDSGNDAAAFAHFDRSVGVANVIDQLHRISQPPRWVTDAERGQGFTELAEAILRARDHG